MVSYCEIVIETTIRAGSRKLKFHKFIILQKGQNQSSYKRHLNFPLPLINASKQQI